jgi:CheY-like chemotaxis protein
VEALVRSRYPEALVRPADPFGSLDGQLTWYVYRRSPMAESTRASLTTGAADDPAHTSQSYADVPVYAPGVVAQLVGVPLAVLVGWDERDGLVRPTIAGGRRLYSRNQVDELRRLKREITAGSPPERLPGVLDDHRAARPKGTRAKPRPRRHVAVLVAERDPFAAEFVEYLLRTEGYGVTVAYGTSEAESMVGAERPDLAIVETLLPDGGALELCARLAAMGVPVIAVASVDGESAALGAGASAFLPKPLQPLRLLSALRDLLGDSAFAREVGRQER